MEIYVYADMQQGLIRLQKQNLPKEFLFYFIFLIQDYSFSDTASPEKKYFQMNALFQQNSCKLREISYVLFEF